jgi:hypothetical protein
MSALTEWPPDATDAPVRLEPAPAAADPRADGGGPVVLVTGSAPPSPNVELFSLDGVPYTIPAKPRVNLALRYLWHAKQYGEDRAAAELLESLLGADGFEVLVNYDDLTTEQFDAIMTAATKYTLGALEDTTGKSGSGRNK